MYANEQLQHRALYLRQHGLLHFDVSVFSMSNVEVLVMVLKCNVAATSRPTVYDELRRFENVSSKHEIITTNFVLCFNAVLFNSIETPIQHRRRMSANR